MDDINDNINEEENNEKENINENKKIEKKDVGTNTEINNVELLGDRKADISDLDKEEE